MRSAPRFFSSENSSLKDAIQCCLCHRRCILAPGKSGACKVRLNRDGKGEIPFYGYITALALDPIEKKPLYHFRPGTEILSIGFAGCNLYCPFCQNWQISQQTEISGRNYTPIELIEAAKKTTNAAQSAIAYTYSEPLVHVEFLLETMKEARKAGVANVLVTNGCINSEAATEILELCDAANVDLKCFSEKTYSEVLGGDLQSVTAFIRLALEKNVHLELTTLLVPGLNDSRAELNKCRDFIAELHTEKIFVPWHLSAYHPDYKWKTPATSAPSLIAAAKRARETLAYVYVGNIAASNITGGNDTNCPYCRETLISRQGYRINTAGLSLQEEKEGAAYVCSSCGKRAPIRF